MWDVVWRQASIQLPDRAPTLLKMSLCLSQLQQSHILASRFEAVPSGLSVSLRICQLSLVCADRVRGIIKYFACGALWQKSAESSCQKEETSFIIA